MNRIVASAVACPLLSILLLGDLSASAVSEKTGVGPQPRITVDAAKAGEPISKYIYAQFIEHLGRCIYGGIWAEMLEDRKFHFPISPEYAPYRGTDRLPQDAAFPAVAASPWQIMGSADSVAMVKQDPFVGDHTPLIAPGSGIRQRDLGLVKDKDYIGYIWLKAEKKSASVKVSLVWGEDNRDRQTTRIPSLSNKYRKFDIEFTAAADTNKGMVEIEVADGACFVGTVSLMPGDNISGMRADTLKLLRELNAPMYRWPGGNFVSGYDWRDGIGERDRRPPRKNPAWIGVEHNDFGLDEFIAFCREVNAEPLIVVNTGFGDAYSAAQETEYANGSTDTIGGGWRAKNGHPEPYGVKWWGIGNEMYGPWQLGFMKLRHYTAKHNQVADYMRQIDPTIKLIGVGALGRINKEDLGEQRGWSQAMLEQCADRMDLISEHFYCGRKDDLVEHIRQIPDQIKQKAEGHRSLRKKLPNLWDRDIRIAMDEWNYWHRPYVYGDLGCIYRLEDALGIAAGLHEYYRNTDIITMAHYAQTVNVIGCIKTSKTHAAFATTGLVLKLYRNRFGEIPVAAQTSGPLDVMAALTTDKKTLTIGIVNPAAHNLELPLEVEGVRLSGPGVRWQITGDGPMAYNEPGKEPRVKIEETAVHDVSRALSVTPYSVTLYALDVK